MDEETANLIRKLRKQGFTYRQIQNRTGVNRGNISRLLSTPSEKGFDEWGRDKRLLASGKIKRAVGG